MNWLLLAYDFYINSFRRIMGQQESNKSSSLIDHNWIPIKSDQSGLFTNVNPFAKRRLRNQFTNQQVQQYELEFASEQDYKHYTEELRIRLQPSNKQMLREQQSENYFNSSPYIYTVKYFVNQSMQDMCSTFYKGMVYADKVDLRLKQINDIPLSDQLYLIRTTLQGFKLLYERVGYFDITEQMIFISKMGRVKVWINPNLSKNNPFYIPTNSFRDRDPHGSQSHMIASLLELIELNTDNQHSEAIHFQQYLLKKNIYDRLSFYKALEEFEAYCMQEHLTPDESMRSIYELYYQDQNMQPQKSEVLQMSLHRDGGHLMGLHPKKQDMLSPHRDSINSPIYRDNLAVFSPNVPYREDPNKITGSKASKTSRRSQSHNVFVHHPNERHENQHSHLSIPASENHRQKTPCFGSTHSIVPTLHFGGQLVNRQYSHEASVPHYPPLPRRQLYPQQPSIRVASQPTVSTGRNTSVTKNNQEVVVDKSQQPLDKSQHAVVRFNYSSSLPQTIIAKPVNTVTAKPPMQQIPRQQLPTNLATILTINSSAGSSGKQVSHQHLAPLPVHSAPPPPQTSPPDLPPVQPQAQAEKLKERFSKVSYYSTNQMYTLDRQIAEDLQRFLGYPLS